jgi:acyl-CoA thioesterase 8
MSDKPMPDLSRIESALSLSALTEAGIDVFTNANSLWNPPWGRGIFGGAAIAQSLVAAQATVPASFSVHSMHCYFIFAANSIDPIVYSVERLRNGNSYITRMVQATQKGKRIFITTLSFACQGRAKKMLEHSVPMTTDLTPPSGALKETSILTKAGHTSEDRPCDCVRCPVSRTDHPYTRKLRHWMRARGRISDRPLDTGMTENNHQAHVAALAYMTDTYFIGTVYRAHNASRFTNKRIVDRALAAAKHESDGEIAERRRFFEHAAQEESDENKDVVDGDLQIDMMASLDHTIYFHNPHGFRADEWMLVEMDTPWAGNERGLVVQRIWSRDGMLIATCVQEGVVRLFQDVGKSHI